MKYWLQIPPFLLFGKFMASLQFLNGGAAFSLFLTLRYYSQLRYPFLKTFESYYVETLQLNETFDKAQITWAAAKEPKTFIVPVEKFKQIHYLNHKTEDQLEEHLPFKTLEAGFDDNKIELIYRTIYFQVEQVV